MTRRSVCLWLLLCVTLAAAPAARPAQPAKGAARPKLVLVLVVDQFRFDYLTRFRDSYTGGFARLLEGGAVFTNARLGHFPTVTAVGHASILTGAPPSVTGIVGNEWYDREEGKTVTSVSDDKAALLGGGAGRKGNSPRRLLADTLGDEMKLAGDGKPKVIGVSLKDRAAILTSGLLADGAYWFDDRSGNFVSSTYYFDDLPPWVKAFNSSRTADRFAGAEWSSLAPAPGTAARPFFKMAPVPDAKYYAALESTPYGNDLVEAFAEAALEGERLGLRGGTDLLIVSFSANDYAGHKYGPYAAQTRDISVRTDRILGKLMRFVDARLGAGSTLTVLTADHGVAPMPDPAHPRFPGGWVSEKAILDAAESALDARYGQEKWIVGNSMTTPYFDRELVSRKGLNQAEVEQTAAAAVARAPHVARVYTRSALENGQVVEDFVGRRVANGFNWRRSGDLFVVLDPYWVASTSASGTSHSTPYSYDTHVPLVFMGTGIRAGFYHREASTYDIAPTLATVLGIQAPGGTAGRALDEILSR